MAEVEKISTWTTKQVLNWFGGLDDDLQCYIPNLDEACLTGAQLLALNYDDLNNLGITLIGHQELVLEGVELLKQLHFGLDTENLQSHALDLNCKCRALRSSICSHHQSEDDSAGEALKRGSSIPLLRLAVDVLDCAKNLILWLDRPPFLNRNDTRSIRASIVKLSYELSTTMQQTVFACVIEEAALSVCKEVEQAMNQLIVSSDPMTIQPCSLELAHMVNTDPSSSLGLFIKATFEGHLVITGTKDGSISSRIRRISAGDDVVAVGGQTVIGWQLSKLVAALKNSPKDIALTLKKRPTFSNTSSSVVTVRRPQPERVLTVAPAISPIRKVSNSQTDKSQLKTEPHNVFPKKTSGKHKKKVKKKARYGSSEFHVPSSGQEPRISSSQRNSCNSFGSSHDGSLLSSSSCEAALSVSAEHSLKHMMRGAETDQMCKKVLHKSIHNIVESEKPNFSDRPNEIDVTELKKIKAQSREQSRRKRRSEEHGAGHLFVANQMSSPLELLTIPSPPTSPYTPRSEGMMGSTPLADACPAYASKCGSSESPNSFMDSEHRRRFTVIGSEEMDEHWREALLREINANKSNRMQNRPPPFVLERLDEGAVSEVSATSACNSFNNKEVTVRLRRKKTNSARPRSMPTNYYSPIKVCHDQQNHVVSFSKQHVMGDEVLPVAHINDRGVKKLAPLSCSAGSDYSQSKDAGVKRRSSSRSYVLPPPCNGNNSNNCPAEMRHPGKHQTSDSAKWNVGCWGSNVSPEVESSVARLEEFSKASQQKTTNKTDVVKELAKFWERKRNVRSSSNCSDFSSLPPQSQIHTEKTHCSPSHATEQGIYAMSASEPARHAAIPIPKPRSKTKSHASATDVHSDAKEKQTNAAQVASTTVCGEALQHTPSKEKVQKSKPGSDSNVLNSAKATRPKKSPSRESYIAAIDVGYALENLRKSSNRNMEDAQKVPNRESFGVAVVGGVPVRLRKNPKKRCQVDAIRDQDLDPDMRSQRRISCRDLGQGECNGWLWKKKTGNNSALSPRWTKRWVVLKEGALYCYRTEDGEKAESYIKLAGYQVMPAPENKRKFAFRVVHPQRKTFYFASDRQSDMSRWMNKMGLNAIEFVFPSDVGKKEIGGSNGDDQYYSESESEDAFYPSGVSSDQPLRSSGQVVALSMSSSSQNKATNLEQVHPSNEPIVDEPRSRDPPQRFVSNQSALNKIGKGGETSDFSDSLKDTPNSSPGTVPVASPRKKPAVSACQRDVHQAQPSQSLQVEGIGSHGADLQHSRSAEHSEHLKTTFSKADECEFRFSSDSEGNTRPKREIAVLLDTAKAAAQPWKVDSSIDDLCKALQDAEVDIHGVKRRVTLKRKMTILSRDPKKNELMLRKRAIQRQLKALQLEVEYFDSLLDQENISSKDLHAWINEHLSLVADLGTIRRISGRKPDDFQEHNSEGDTLLPSINSLPSTSVQLPTHLTFNDEQFSVTRSAPTVRTLPRAMTEERSSYQPLSGIGGDATTDKGAGPASNTSTPHRPRSSAFSSGESLPSRPLSEADSLRCRPAMQEKVHSQQLLRKQYLETDL